MSTTAPTPAAPSSGYSLGRPAGKCAICGRDIAPGEKFTAAVRESAAGLERLDLSAECWTAFDKTPLLAYWQATMPTSAAERPKVFVDDSVLCELFERLAASEASDEPAKVNFRFVLGLILMRKRLLVYESSHATAGKEYWSVRMKGRTEPIDLINPRLDEEQVAQVSAQLGQILSGEPA